MSGRIEQGPEMIARRFHEAYERLAPDFGYETRKASAVPWEDVPEQNRSLMVAVVAHLLDAGLLVNPQQGVVPAAALAELQAAVADFEPCADFRLLRAARALVADG